MNPFDQIMTAEYIHCNRINMNVNRFYSSFVITL